MHASRSLYYKEEKDFAEFYKSSLLYLAFISSDALPESVRLVRVWVCSALPKCCLVHSTDASMPGCCLRCLRASHECARHLCALARVSDGHPHALVQSLAVDISLAALLGDNIYNFGELLLHPIVRLSACACSCLISPLRA